MSETFDPRLKNKSAIIVYGSAASGKSALCLELIRRRKTAFKEPVNRVVYVYKEYQKEFNEFKHDAEVIFVDHYSAVRQEVEEYKGQHCLVVFDDQIVSIEGDRDYLAYLESFFVYRATHQCLVPVFITHTLFSPKIRLCSLNCKVFLLFRNRRDVTPISVLGNQLGVGNLLKLALDDISATDNYGFLCCDLTNDCPEHLRYRNFIWEKPDMKFYTKP